MNTSPAGRTLIEQREGRRLDAYLDTQGIPTIGVGHTGRMSPPKVTMGMTITEAQCDAMLASDLAPVEAVIATAVKVPISQNEFDALASLGFNIGAKGLKGSTVIKKLNVGDVLGAAEAFMNWSKPAVLVGRRRQEMAQFLRLDPDVADARSKVLATKASASRSQAKATNVAAGGVAAGAAVIVATAPAQTSHMGLIVGVAVALFAAGALLAIIAAAKHAAAASLSANSLKQ